MPKLAIDLRSLNYPVRTGINLYFLNILKILENIKSENNEIEVIGFGLNTSSRENIELEFAWFKNLFNEQLSLAQFSNVTFLEKIWVFPKKNLNSVINLGIWLLNILGIQFIENRSKITHVFQPQIKSILIPKNTNWVVAVHDFFHFQINSWLNLTKRPNESKLLANKILRNITTIWANSISTANQTKQFFPKTFSPENKIKLIYPGLPNGFEENKSTVKKLNQTLAKHEELLIKSFAPKKYFVAIAGIEPRKNWINLLHAWKILEDKMGWEYSLVLAGRVVDQRYYSDLIKLQKSLGLRLIVWKLDITEQDKSSLICESVAVVYPSLFEGFGFPILESWQNLVPCIVGNMGSSLEIGQGGVVAINPLDVEEIASAIELLTVDNIYRQTLIDSGQRRLKLFSWKEYKGKLENWLSN